MPRFRGSGETEAQIADAFAEARRSEAVLLFDEADPLLFDRTTARTSWEVGQVNELLTWLDRHPLPVVAATNHEARLDLATLSRFVFKFASRRSASSGQRARSNGSSASRPLRRWREAAASPRATLPLSPASSVSHRREVRKT